MPHIVLLGDSVFDNALYVAGGPDVRTLLQACMPGDWRVTLLAVDGDRTQVWQSNYNTCRMTPVTWW